MLTKLHLTQNNNVICAGDFNLLFNIKLENYGGNPVFKKLSVRKIFELKETYNLMDIWKIRNPKAKQYTFLQKHVPSKTWEFLKYQIRKFTIKFSKMCAKEEWKQREELETTLKLLKKPLLAEENQCLYDKCKWQEIYYKSWRNKW